MGSGMRSMRPWRLLGPRGMTRSRASWLVASLAKPSKPYVQHGRRCWENLLTRSRSRWQKYSLVPARRKPLSSPTGICTSFRNGTSSAREDMERPRRGHHRGVERFRPMVLFQGRRGEDRQRSDCGRGRSHFREAAHTNGAPRPWRSDRPVGSAFLKRNSLPAKSDHRVHHCCWRLRDLRRSLCRNALRLFSSFPVGIRRGHRCSESARHE